MNASEGVPLKLIETFTSNTRSAWDTIITAASELYQKGQMPLEVLFAVTEAQTTADAGQRLLEHMISSLQDKPDSPDS